MLTGGVGASLKLLSDGSGSSAKLDAEQIILSGSVKAGQLAADSVTTEKLTVGSVSIEKLIDGAASEWGYAAGADTNVTITRASDYPGYSLFASSQSVTFATTSIDTEIGEITIEFQTQFKYAIDCYASTDAAAYFHYIDVVVDGVTKKTFTVRLTTADTTWIVSPDNNSFKKIVVTGLSDGSHTIAIKSRVPASCTYGPGNFVFTHYDNFVMAFERRN